MARVDRALLCDLAFFDRQDRLCVEGIVRKMSVPRLPLALSQMMLVAHLVEIRPVDEVEVTVAVALPGGQWTRPASAETMVIEMAGEYVLVTLRDIPLVAEGIYSFKVGLQGQPDVSVDIPILTVNRATVPVPYQAPAV